MRERACTVQVKDMRCTSYCNCRPRVEALGDIQVPRPCRENEMDIIYSGCICTLQGSHLIWVSQTIGTEKQISQALCEGQAVEGCLRVGNRGSGCLPQRPRSVLRLV